MLRLINTSLEQCTLLKYNNSSVFFFFFFPFPNINEEERKKRTKEKKKRKKHNNQERQQMTKKITISRLSHFCYEFDSPTPLTFWEFQLFVREKRNEDDLQTISLVNY